MATRLPLSGLQYWDATNQEAYAGALMYTYEGGTTSTLKTTYTTAGEGTANANPVVADANGVFPEIYGNGEYYVKIRNADDDTTIYDEDNVKASSIGAPGVDVLTSSGTYTVPNGVSYLKVTCVGGGGGGGSANATTSWQGAGGGSGGISTVVISSPNASYTYTIGAGGAGAANTSASAATSGGNTIFGAGSNCRANGGSGATTYSAGAGGLVTSAVGDVTLPGQAGGAGDGPNADGTNATGGSGGGIGGGTAGNDASTNSGGGGGGGYYNGANVAAGDGADGYIIVEYFI